MTKTSTQPAGQLIDPISSKFLDLCSDHKLTREDFYYRSGKKQTEKRINALAAADLLLRNTYFKNIKVCLHTRTSYMFTPSGSIYRPFSQNQVKWFISGALDKLGIQALIRPGYIDDIFKVLKNNSKLSVTAPVLLHKGTLPR